MGASRSCVSYATGASRRAFEVQECFGKNVVLFHDDNRMKVEEHRQQLNTNKFAFKEKLGELWKEHQKSRLRSAGE